MNNHDQDYGLPSPRTNLFGATRPSTNPRIHSIVKPYNRPASFQDGLAGPSYLIQNGNKSPTKSPTKQLPSTRPSMQKSFSSSNLGQMTRSNSETGLFSGFKSMLSRPLAWLATPSRSQRTQGKKRDGGWDEEEPGSPTDGDRGMKRARRRSPSPPKAGDYAPEQTRPVPAFVLPSLPAHVSLQSKNKQNPIPGLQQNYSRPLHTSRSVPHFDQQYLDPPTNMLGEGKKKGALTRSRKLDIGAGDGEDDRMGQEEKQKEQWSPWKNSNPGRTRASLTPARYTPTRGGEGRDLGFPSSSPFRVPPSPSAPRQPSGLSRSATMSQLRQGSMAASDVSMGRESARGHSQALVPNGHDEDRMSITGVHREGSAMGWYAKDQRQGGGSPSARAASMRLGSAGPSSGLSPIRKGQMVWDADKGFLRESDLRANGPQPVHQNDAERILFALESARKTPLTEARSSSAIFGSIPPELIGSSSRALRKAISVPLATAQAGDSARQRREKERLGDDYNVVISPYGRRKAVERDHRDHRIERSRSEMDAEYRPTHSPSRSIGSRSEASSKASTDMRSEPSATPSPAPTPRRSARNKRKDDEHEEPTPKAKRGSKKSAPESSNTKETPRKRTTRQGTADKATSPPPPPRDNAQPPVPTITETAPSPRQSTTSTYQIRDDNAPREKSNLRAKSDITKRTHQSAANSRAVSPTSGRYSAREEDLPPMEELESTQIKLPSFQGMTFAGFGPLAPPPAPAPTPAAEASSTSNAQPSKSSLSIPTGRPGPLSRLNSSRPRASSPLASGSIVAQPESPPEAGIAAPPAPDSTGFFSLGASSSTTPSKPPPLFANIPNDMRTEASKKTGASLGLGKPSAPAADKDNASRPPVFFGDKGASAPILPPPTTGFKFDIPKPAQATKTPAAPTFNFAPKPAENGAAPGTSVFGGTPVVVPAASSAAPSFGNGFSFGQPAKQSAEDASASAAPPAPASFSFLSSTADKPATASSAPAAKPFGLTGAPAATPSLNSSPGGFNFGQPAAKPAESAPAPAPLTFGSAAPVTGSNLFGGAAPAPEAPKASTPAASSPFGGFSFNKPAEAAAPAPAAPAPAASNPFAFGKSQPATGFNFGAEAPKANGTAAPSEFGSAPPSPAAKPASTFVFGGASAAPAPAAASSPFQFGAPTSTPTNGFGAAPAAPAPAAGGFGGGFGSGFNSSPAVAAPPGQSSFNFNANPPTPTSGFGAPTPTNSGFGAPAAPAPAPPSTPGGFGTQSNFTFGQAASTTPAGTPSFAFGASTPSTPAAAPVNGGFGFGAQPAAPPAQTFGGFGAAPPTPTGAAGGTFQFGAPAANNQNQPPRFGSPQPGQQGADGGFSMGMAPSEPPGSPRRAIKGMKKRK